MHSEQCRAFRNHCNYNGIPFYCNYNGIALYYNRLEPREFIQRGSNRARRALRQKQHGFLFAGFSHPGLSRAVRLICWSVVRVPDRTWPLLPTVEPFLALFGVGIPCSVAAQALGHLHVVIFVFAPREMGGLTNFITIIFIFTIFLLLSGRSVALDLHLVCASRLFS